MSDKLFNLAICSVFYTVKENPGKWNGVGIPACFINVYIFYKNRFGDIGSLGNGEMLERTKWDLCRFFCLFA